VDAHVVPSTQVFLDPAYVERWERETAAKHPERPAFFDTFVSEVLQFGSQVEVLELGSGPGVLAEQILSRCAVSRYHLVDFSAPMHDLARRRLGEDSRAVFVESDFRESDWADGIPRTIDVVVSMQAVHELRHSKSATSLYRELREVVRPSAVLLICDQLRPDGDRQSLFMTADEHLGALHAAGVTDASVVLTIGNMALFKGMLRQPA